MTIRLSRTTAATLVALVALAGGAAVLRAQEPAPQLPIGVVDMYRIEEQAPQFAAARASVEDLQGQLTAVMQVAASYRFLTPAELDEAVTLYRLKDTRTRQQRERLTALADLDAKHAARFHELPALPEGSRSVGTDAEFAQLLALYDACEQHQNDLVRDARGKLAGEVRAYEEKVAVQFNGAVEQVAREQGLAMVLEKRVRIESAEVDPTLQSLGYQYRRVVHYGGTDVTDAVVAELIRRNNEANGVPAP